MVNESRRLEPEESCTNWMDSRGTGGWAESMVVRRVLGDSPKSRGIRGAVWYWCALLKVFKVVKLCLGCECLFR